MMTTDIERQFFDTFGIEPIRYKRNNAMVYPQITDRMLLKLICLLSCEFGDKLNLKTLKKRMMQESMCCYRYKGKLNEKFKQKVQALFKEG